MISHSYKHDVLSEGLSSEEVTRSRERYGANVLTPPEKASLLSKFLQKFKDPLILILLVAGALSIGISLYEYYAPGEEQGDAAVFFEPVGIVVAILLATGLAFYFEVKADREFDLLNQVNDDVAVQVVRDGSARELPRRDIVVGDVVLLTTGCEVPADGVLLQATALQVDESTLTGEPLCAKTTVEADFDANATFPSNHVLRGTTVMEGHGICRITAVGDHTECGKVFVAAQIDNSVKTPLNEQLEGLATRISVISYVLATLILVVRTLHFLLVTPQWDWVDLMAHLLQACMMAVTVVVVAVPEGLPMAVTLSLAYSMRRMLRTDNLVRKMHACETMGAATVICTDKTGTLTQNRMRVDTADFFTVDATAPEATEAGRRVIESIAVNSTALLDTHEAGQPRVLGNPTEGALLLWLYDRHIDFLAAKSAATVVEELPFSTERKYMATVVVSAVTGRRTLYVKGAPEVVMALCRDTVGNIDEEHVKEQLRDYQRRAMRTLAFAYLELDTDAPVIAEHRLTAEDLHLMGVVAIADPVRPDVPAAVRKCLAAGISVKIVTGDTSATACEIGRQVGLWGKDDSDAQLITGPELAALSDEELAARAGKLKIISRARPMDKKRLVETLQQQGEVVAVTGDGTNDAPALKAAHVGLSMGDGTSVAKEASDITILDNSFVGITRAVMWGRSLYQNIRRFILFQMTVNVVACLVVLVGAFAGDPSPLTVTQMLWVNLIMDTFAAVALASLPPSEAVLNEPPRARTAFIINRPMWRRILLGGAFFLLLLMGALWLFHSYDITSLTDLARLPATPVADSVLTPYELSLFFTFFVLLQFWNMFNARAFATHRSAFHLRGCRGFLIIAGCILVGQWLIVTLGGRMFSVVPLHAVDWGILLLATSVVLWMGEVERLFSHR
jgi:Ca2+-transporting ATPase